MRNVLSILLLSAFYSAAYAQGNVGIGTGSPNASSMLDITATDKGLLIPRVALSATNLASPVSSPATSLMVYNTATAGSGATAVTPGYYYWNGSAWVRLLIGSGVNSAWMTTGNAGTSGPAAPGTYGTSTIGASENWIGTSDAQPFTIGTSGIERMRITSSGLMGIGTATPNANYLMTINPFNDTYRSGIDMNFPGSGTILTTAYGIDIDVALNQNIRGFRYLNNTTGNGPLWGTGSELSATNIVSGYTAYRNSSGLSFGLYGINGTNSTYATNANTWAAFLQGRTVISSESSPSSPLGVDLEVRNTSTGASSPATISMRQSTQLVTANSILANLNFGDNYQTGPQAQIQVLREQPSANASDLPTSIGFFTIPDGSTTLTERVRISNNGNVGVGITAPDVSALLDISSTSKGIRIPSVALTATNAAGPVTTPATSLLVYNTATAGVSPTNVVPGFYYNAGTSVAPNWKRFTTGNSDAWTILGNNNTASPAAPATYGTSVISASENLIGARNNVDVIFGTNNLERMRLFSSGQLSLGSALAGAKLDVHQVSSNDVARFTTYANPNEFLLRRTQGTQSAPTIVGADGVLGRIWGQGYDGTTFRSAANISFEVDATSGASDMPGRITFSTTPDGSFTPSERMRINNTGNVGMGTTTIPTESRLVLGALDASNEGGQIQLNAPGGSYTTAYFMDNYQNNLRFMTGTNTGSSTVRMNMDNAGNVSIPTGYLTVGNTSAPTAQTGSQVLYSHTFSAADGGWTRAAYGSCGNTQQWVLWSDQGNTWQTTGMRWDNETANNADAVYSPWIWIPNGANPDFSMMLYIDIESGYDGAVLEYSTNGSTWTRVSSFLYNGYNGTTSGNCAFSGSNAWTGYQSSKLQRWSLSLSSTWVRFRIIASCDGSNSSGYGVYIYGFSADMAPNSITAYASGNIYAEKNVYAGSNVLRGDVAEYFPVDTKTEPGTLISIKEGFADQYTISGGWGDDRVIGITSTAPTLLLNNPKSGTPVALTGRVPVKVNNEGGPIRIGDYLVASSMPGEATKTTKPAYVIGRALENFDGESGTVLCLVQNGYYNPGRSFDMERSLGSFTSKSKAKKIIVYDDAITSESKVFLTYRNKVGTENWVSKIDQGFFEVEYDKQIAHAVKFDYLIENARVSDGVKSDIHPASPVVVISNDQFDRVTQSVSFPEKDKNALAPVDPVMKAIQEQGKSTFIALPEETGHALPPAPVDLSTGTAWTQAKGFFQSKTPLPSESEFLKQFDQVKPADDK